MPKKKNKQTCFRLFAIRVTNYWEEGSLERDTRSKSYVCFEKWYLLVYLLRGWVYKYFSDSFTGKRPVEGGRFQHAVASWTPKRVRSVVVRRNETVLGYPMDRFQLLRGDERLRTRKQTHQLHVHVRQNHQRHKQQSKPAVPFREPFRTHRHTFRLNLKHALTHGSK